VEDWSDIVAVAAGWFFTAGLKSDGTVVATGFEDGSIDEWSGIVAVAAGDYHLVGLKEDGTVVAAGRNNYGSRNVYAWDVKLPD
jgi:alpha-tubulin suppressor-like RCC1 family protein